MYHVQPSLANSKRSPALAAVTRVARDARAGLSGGRHISNQDASMLRYLSEVINRESQSDGAAEHQRTYTSETAPVDAAKTKWFDDAPENIRRIAIATRAREEYEE